MNISTLQEKPCKSFLHGLFLFFKQRHSFVVIAGLGYKHTQQPSSVQTLEWVSTDTTV